MLVPRFSGLPLFTEAAAEMLPILRDRLGFPSWIVAQKAGGQWLALAVDGHMDGLGAGYSCAWADTLCARLLRGPACQLVLDVPQLLGDALPSFARDFNVASYVGVPLICPQDGSHIGALCAFDVAPRSADLPLDRRFLETCGRTLSRFVYADVRIAKQQRRLRRLEAVALCDSLTGLYNRRGWNQLLKAEESRCRRHGHSACVASIDLDDLKVVNDSKGHEAGDNLLREAAVAIRTAVRAQDVAARVGGDEFAVLGVESSQEGLAALHARLASALADAGIRASIGVATRNSDLAAAWRDADDAMYQEKRTRKSRVTAGDLCAEIAAP